MGKAKDYIEVYKREDGKFDWRRVDGGNYRVVMNSANQGFDERNDARASAERYFPKLEIREVGGKGAAPDERGE
jgi:hypothetical protein